MFARITLGAVSAIALAMAATAPAQAGNVTDEMILNDAVTPTSVLTYGLGSQGQRYSPLKQINRDTVKSMVPAFSFSFGGGPTATRGSSGERAAACRAGRPTLA